MLNLSPPLSTGRSPEKWPERASKGVPQISWPAVVTVFLLVSIPLVYWSGLWDPALFKDLTFSWPDPTIGLIAGVSGAALIVIPLIWTLWSGRLDVAGLALVTNGLIFFGYYFIDETAGKQGGKGYDTAHYVGMLVLFNAIGFAILLLTMGAVYFIQRHRRITYRPWPQAMDDSLQWLLRGAGLACSVVLIMPMAQHGTIPLFAPDATQARFDMVESSWIRPLYHMGSALLPLVVAGIIVLILRKPSRIFGLDGLFVGLMVLAQILTGNRLPLANTMVVTLALASMEFRMNKIWFLVIFLIYIGAYTFLSGLTALWRTRDLGPNPGMIFQNSMREAFVGDNIIDLRDGSWVFSKWDFKPYKGLTYAGGLVAFMPSGLFPEKKEWHLGMTALRIVGWEDKEHFGLRISFFAEAFLNFGIAGVVGLGLLVGTIFGLLLSRIQAAFENVPPRLSLNLCLVATMQMSLPLGNSADAFISWSMAGFLFLVWSFVIYPNSRNSSRPGNSRVPQHA